MNALLVSLISQIPTTPEEAMTWVKALKEAGFVGVSIVEAVVIYIQWKTARADLKEKDDKIISVLEKSNESIKNTLGALKGGQ